MAYAVQACNTSVFLTGRSEVMAPSKLSVWGSGNVLSRGSGRCSMQDVKVGDRVVPEKERMRPGSFGAYGGKYVPETLISCLSKLEAEFNMVLTDDRFQAELATALRDYVGREMPLYFAERLTSYYKNKKGEGPEIYLKREDLNHGGAHKMNNAIAQVMIAKRMGRRQVMAATGAGQHGMATAAACAKLSLDCTVFMGSADIVRQSHNVLLMKLFGAKVVSVEGSFKDASSQAIREWVGNLENSYYLTGTVVGPHPCPSMVKEFQSVIGKETRKQAMDRWGGKPDVLVACTGSGSNGLGMFHEFIGDEDVSLIGVEAAGFGLDSGKHAATLTRGEVGVCHGSMSYLLQNSDGQVLEPHSIGIGLEYPGVGPELSFLKDMGRAEFYVATDQEALNAYQLLCRLEGIIPAMEAAHALAYLEKLCPSLPNGPSLPLLPFLKAVSLTSTSSHVFIPRLLSCEHHSSMPYSTIQTVKCRRVGDLSQQWTEARSFNQNNATVFHSSF